MFVPFDFSLLLTSLSYYLLSLQKFKLKRKPILGFPKKEKLDKHNGMEGVVENIEIGRSFKNGGSI